MFDGSQPPVEIKLAIENTRVENHLVVVGEKYTLSVVEHLFSALYGLNHFNVRIEVYGGEIPFLDGSSRDFVAALEGLETTPCSGIRIDDVVYVNDAHGSLHYTPADGNKLLVEMSLSHPYIGTQNLAMEITPASYAKSIAPARTFVFTEENDERLKDLPPYGIGITSSNIFARSPLRFADEPVRHKLLDLLGDLYVLGRPVYGRIKAKNTSHRLNLCFVRELLAAHSMLRTDRVLGR